MVRMREPGYRMRNKIRQSEIYPKTIRKQALLAIKLFSLVRIRYCFSITLMNRQIQGIYHFHYDMYAQLHSSKIGISSPRLLHLRLKATPFPYRPPELREKCIYRNRRSILRPLKISPSSYSQQSSNCRRPLKVAHLESTKLSTPWQCGYS